MLDEERRELIRTVELGDEEAIPRIQQMNDRLGLSLGDAEYLQKYVELCERYLTGSPHARRLNVSEAEEELIALNKTFRTSVGSKTLKKSLLGSNLHDSEGWVPSEICY